MVAAAFVAGVRREGFEPDGSLRLLGWAAGSTEAPAVADPSELGELHQRLLSSSVRKGRGVWYTPAWLAEHLVDQAVDGPGLVADPACGGGAFLLAAADRLGTADHLWGCDVDPLAVAVTEAALWWWSARKGEPTVAGDRVVVGDTLTTTPIPPAVAVVGNPPFLGQLKRGTAASPERRRALRERFGQAVRPYTDEAWLFLLAALDAVPRGTVALVQPRSLLGARDAAAVRAAVDDRAELVDLWLDDGSTFEAGVHACAPVLRSTAGGAGNDWSSAVGDRLGVPRVELPEGPRLGDRADVLAGFRDEYYGLVDAVREDAVGPRLVTSGAIDPLRLLDGPVRFAKQRWHRPSVDRAKVAGKAARWVDSQRGPKLIVATQTRVLEAVVDPDGSLVGSVPAIVVRPHTDADLWRLAAALHAPVATAWVMRRAPGTALVPDACKPSAGVLADLPLPLDHRAWDAAAGIAQEVAAGAGRWSDLAAAADAAYGVTDGVAARWWLDRLPLRSRA